ncbi:uncharacterized protein (DUF1501 family) [Sphingomonas kaistensis]|uniref:Uncharacterized protein (DUF1501 family) n=1 Tax=Sphingomonas kaistensis TaxID=298708 RepID=A0A7X6BH74_9SPHN|nr:DUF1501 domain-containing protein [Sphingomonas kaistensis]NJC06653.1 uncharacterized protein (DUF1501 family) [Sphingomonas kaistensis]
MDRRSFLATGASGIAAVTFAPHLAFAAAATDRRFLFVIQRGAADGLAILAPTGDPGFAGLRPQLGAEAANGTKLDAMFTLHPALKQVAAMTAAKQALLVHAVASPYRDRSHFDGQNVLETGGALPYRMRDGWMNRLVRTMPDNPQAIAFAPTVPPALRGSARVASYAPSNLPAAGEDLMIRVGDLYANDAQLGPLWNEALQARTKAGDLATGRGAVAAGALAARMMKGPGGARIGMVETDGWDTHTAQRGRLNAQLTGLDAVLAAFRDGLGEDWNNTLVLVATEFGRTARENGTGGTDHGTGSTAFLLGGAVAGGKVVADWPGLAPTALYEARDLKPTINLDALIATALGQHFGQDPARMAQMLFPDTGSAPLRQKLVLS